MKRRNKIVVCAAVTAVLVASVRPVDETAASGPLVLGLNDHGLRLVVVRASPATGQATLTKRSASGAAPAAAEAQAMQVEVSAKTTRLRFAFDGLEPATEYDYALRVIEGASETRFQGRVKTAPLPGKGAVRFAAFGDSGKIPWWTYASAKVAVGPAPWLEGVLPGRGQQWDIAALVAQKQVDLVLHLGDIVYPKGAREHYNEAYFEPFANIAARVPVWPAIGNHDVMTENGQPVVDYFDLERRYFDFVHGPVHFFCIDMYSSAMDKASEQRKWLAERLAQSSAPWKVAFTHRPFHTVSRSKDDADNAMLRDEVHPMLAAAGVRFVFSGHDHNYQRFRAVDSVHYIVAGGGGKSLYELGSSPDLVLSLRDYSLVIVDADERRMRLEAIDVHGQVFDRVEETR